MEKLPEHCAGICQRFKRDNFTWVERTTRPTTDGNLSSDIFVCDYENCVARITRPVTDPYTLPVKGGNRNDRNPQIDS